MKDFKTRLQREWKLVLTSIIGAIVLWAVVVSVSDPETTKDFTTVVTVTNENVLTSTGKYYRITNDNNTVTYRVSAKRSIIEKLSGTDFTAIADMRNLEENTRIPVDITPNKQANQIEIISKQRYLNINVESQMSNTFTILATTVGEPAEGCVVQDVTANPSYIEVTGREADVSRIDKIIATVDVSGRNSDLTALVIPVVYDAEGNVIDTTNLTLSKRAIEVSCTLTNVKTVGITVETSGTLQKDLELDEVKAEPGTIVIRGSRNVINSITNIVVPGEVVNLSTVTGDFTTTVDITEYLPEGVKLNDSSNTQVKISVVIARPISKTFQISRENIAIRNLSDKYEAAIKNENIEVSITGVTSKIDKLDASKITGYVDAQGLSTGSQGVPVILNLNSDDYDVEDIKVTLVLREKRTDSNTSGSTGTTGNGENTGSNTGTTGTGTDTNTGTKKEETNSGNTTGHN